MPPLISSGISFLRPGPVGEVVDLLGDRPQAQVLGVADHRHDQALVVEVDGDAEVDEAVDDELVLAHAGVEVREVAEGVDRRPADERQVREAEALGLLPLVLDRAARGVDVGVVDLDDAEGVRADALAHHHVLAGEPADLRQRDRLVALAGGDRRCRRRLRRRRRRRWRRAAGRRSRCCGRGLLRRLGLDGRRGAAAASAAGADAVLSMWSSTSSRVMRPPGPVPLIAAGSRPCSLTRRRTTGDSSDALGVGVDGRRLRALVPAPAARAPPPRRGSGSARPASPAAGASVAPPASGSGRPAPRRRAHGASSAAGCRRGGRRTVAVADDGDDRADVDRLALLDPDLGERAGDRRRHLGVDLVRRHLEQRLVGGDRVADLLEPLRDRALGDGLTELRQGHFGHRASSSPRGSAVEVAAGEATSPSRRTARSGSGAAG